MAARSGPHKLYISLGISSDQRCEPEPVLSSNFGWLHSRLAAMMSLPAMAAMTAAGSDVSRLW